MPDITSEQYAASLRDQTCIVDGKRRTWWSRVFSWWWTCQKCGAHHCGRHRHSKQEWRVFWVNRKYTCQYCGEVTVVVLDGG